MRKDRFNHNIAVFHGDAEPYSVGDDLGIGVSDAELKRRETAKADAVLAELDALVDAIGDDQEHRATDPVAAPKGQVNRNNATPKPGLRYSLLNLVRRTLDEIAADNEAMKPERNARRYKVARGPVEYEKQKARQREEYAAKIAATEGREVRGYFKVQGKTRAEREEHARERAAARMREKRRHADPEMKHREADRKWAKRKEAAGWTPERIAEGLAQRQADRRFDHGEYESNPLYGVF